MTIVIDSTLRDGSQQVGVNLTYDQQAQIAEYLFEAKIDGIDIMPWSNKTHEKLMNAYPHFPWIISTPLIPDAIDYAIKLPYDIILFQAVSDILLKLRNKTRENNISDFHNSLIQIRGKIESQRQIFLVGEDATRGDIDYIIKLINRCRNHINGFIIADSIGGMLPGQVEIITRKLIDCEVKIGIHAHNDLGYADQNTNESLENGAVILTGTVNGAGERAGNADLFQILSQSITHKKINLDALRKCYSYLNQLNFKPIPPFTSDAFIVETGTHIHAMYQAKERHELDIHPNTAYCALDPSLLGFVWQIYFGQNSGESNLRYCFKGLENLNLGKIIAEIKEQSRKDNRSFSMNEIQNKYKLNYK